MKKLIIALVALFAFSVVAFADEAPKTDTGAAQGTEQKMEKKEETTMPAGEKMEKTEKKMKKHAGKKMHKGKKKMEEKKMEGAEGAAKTE